MPNFHSVLVQKRREGWRKRRRDGEKEGKEEEKREP